MQFQHKRITNPTISHADKVMHAIQQVIREIKKLGGIENSQEARNLQTLVNGANDYLQNTELLDTQPRSQFHLAGNVLFCRVFPSLHLQTWRVVSATCRQHVFGHVADTRKCCVGQGVKTTRHLKTCRDMSSNVCNNVIAF